MIELTRDDSGNVQASLKTWSCCYCRKVFADEDLYSPQELLRFGLKIRVGRVHCWFPGGPVCESCGIDRKIPREE